MIEPDLRIDQSRRSVVVHRAHVFGTLIDRGITLQRTIDVVVPALNEEHTIGQTLESLHSHLPQARYVVVDNGSTDDTRKIALSTLERLNCDFRIIDVPLRGKGNAVRAAFSFSDADIVVMIDADSTYPADRILDLISPIVEGSADMVVADRHSSGSYRRENTRSFHEFGNSLILKAVNRMYSSDLHDVLSGYRAFSRRFVQGYPVMAAGFELETDMTLHALDKRLSVTEVPIDYRERPEGSESKLNTFRDGIRVIWTLFNLFRRFRPFAFFGSVSLALFLVAGAAAIPPVQDYVQHQFVYHVPLAVLSSAALTMSLLALAVALVLDSLADHSRRTYELHMLVMSEHRRRRAAEDRNDES